MEVNINDRQHVMFTHKTEDTIDFVLYDSNESWIESSSISGILQRAKEYNKRINFDEKIILSNLEKSKPVSVEWVEDEPSEQNQRNLKIKYSIEGHPLYFALRLRKLTTNEFERYFVCIVENLCEGLTKQNEELRKIVQKKDIINQYTIEEAVLKSVTVGTKPFDASEFEYDSSQSEAITVSSPEIVDVDFPKPLKMFPDNKSSNSDRVDKGTLLPPPKGMRTRSETSRDKSDCMVLRSGRKAKYVEYKSGGRSTEENGNVTPTKKGKSTEKPAIKKKSPSISKSTKKKSPSISKSI